MFAKAENTHRVEQKCMQVGRLPASLRWLCLSAGVVLLALLVVARCLEPSPSGLGTHQQLGFPACTTILVWGMPCPTCGMTTSWALVVRGEMAAAARANLGGFLLAIIAIGYLPASCYFFINGRATSGHWFSQLLAIGVTAAFCVTLLQWAVRVWL